MRTPRGFREVKTFAAAMLRTLNFERHKAKGKLSHVPLHVFRKKFAEERHELEEAINHYYSAGSDTDARIAKLKRVEEESVDAGAVAMMVHAEARRLKRELES